MSRKGNPILDSVRARLWRRNANWISAIVGGVGSGKSWSAISIADYVDNDFSIDKVFFRIADFVNAINEGKITKGSCCVLDEAGISWQARNFMRDENKQISQLFQIMRFLNFGVIMTVPSLYFVDKHGRDLLHAIMKTKTINYDQGYCELEYKLNDFNPILNKPYRKYPRIRCDDGKIRRVASIKVFKPDQSLINRYEEKKKIFAMKLIRDVEDRIRKKAEKSKPGKPVKCKKCGYEWEYKGKTKEPTCPGCHRKTTTKQ